MNLSQAIRYGTYTGAILCQYHWYPSLPNHPVKRRELAYVCRQGGYNCRYWWTVSISYISWEKIPPRFQAYYGGEWCWLAREGFGDCKSYGSIDGCYKWLQEHKISPYAGWYPTKNEQHWSEQGAH